MRNALVPALAVGALFLVCPLVPLRGHAILLSAAPATNETVHRAAVHVQLRFNARIDARRSRLTLVLPGGGQRALVAAQPSLDTLTSNISELDPGPYLLQWQVLAEDGHITRGQLPFRAQ